MKAMVTSDILSRIKPDQHDALFLKLAGHSCTGPRSRHPRCIRATNESTRAEWEANQSKRVSDALGELSITDSCAQHHKTAMHVHNADRWLHMQLDRLEGKLPFNLCALL
jgi:hypothetical protein